ncbi:MAG: SPOR domain-containing protein [Nitrospinae bacterium]|nr:SPOR domain-containing protein [Nitrospinota bacterium]
MSIRKVIGVIAIIAILGGGYYLYPSVVDQYFSPPPEHLEDAEKGSLPQPEESQPEVAAEKKISPEEDAGDKAEAPLPQSPETQPDLKVGQPIVKILTVGKDSKVTSLKNEKEADKVASKDTPTAEEVKNKEPEVTEHTAKAKKKYTVQVGTYIHKSSLIEGGKILSSLGFEGYAFKQTVTLPKYRVMVGRFQKAEEPAEIVTNLINDNIGAKFYVLSPHLYSIYVAGSYDKNEAENLKNDLILRGYSAWVLTSKGKKRAYVLKIKGATDKGEALRRIDALKSRSIEAVLLNK